MLSRAPNDVILNDYLEMRMSLHNRLQLHTEDSLAVLQTLVTQQEAALGRLVTLLTDTVEQGYRIWTMGQGFSHLLAQ